MLSQQEISDRFEIQDLLLRYSHAIDSGKWDGLDTVFTPDAYIDYTALGGSAGSLEETKAFLASAMPGFPAYQHMVGPPLLEIDGDRATGRTICHNPMRTSVDDPDQVMLCGLWYVDTFVRTGDGWRIASRVEEKSFIWNLPDPAG